MQKIINETADKTYSDQEVCMALREMAQQSSLRKAGSLLGVSGAYVHDVLSDRRGLSENLGNALGFEVVPTPAPPPRKWTTRKPKVAA